MTLNQFMFFATVAKHLNVTKASRELQVSQPSITQQLKLLEEQYGAKLYRRYGNGIQLTEAGGLFLTRVKAILDQVEQLKRMFKAPTQSSRRKVLRVGGTFSSSAMLLPSALARFKRSRARVEIELKTRPPEYLERLVLTGVIELAVTTIIPRSVELACEPLRREKLVMFVRSSHRLAKKRNLRLLDVSALPLVFRAGRDAYGVTEKVVQQLKEEGLPLKVGMRCDGPTSVKAAVRGNMGVGIVFEDNVKPEVSHGEFKILNVRGFNLETESFIIYRNNAPLSPPAQQFLELLHRAIPKSQRIEAATVQTNAR